MWTVSHVEIVRRNIRGKPILWKRMQLYQLKFTSALSVDLLGILGENAHTRLHVFAVECSAMYKQYVHIYHIIKPRYPTFP
jgi:DNA-nicking Smr family endonuclease